MAEGLPLRWRNALTMGLLAAAAGLVGAPVLMFAYPELRRVAGAPDWPLLAVFFLAVIVFFVVAGLRDGDRTREFNNG